MRAGTGNGGTDHTTSAGIPSGSRLVASTCTSGHHCSTSSTSSLVVSSTCSQLSSTSSIDCVASRSTIDCSSVRPARCCTSSTAANAAVTAPWSRTGASSTSFTPSVNRSAIVFARRWARRVLPTPPGPNSVRMRPLSSSRVASSRSRSRPTRAVVSIGSALRAGAARVSCRDDGRGHPRELGPLFEDGGLQVTQLGRRLEPEVVAQRGPELLRDPQRLGLATRPVEGEHRLAGEGFAQGVLDEEAVDLAHHLVVTADAQLRLDAHLDRHQAELGEADRLGPDPLGLGEFGEGVAVPLGERGVEAVEGGDGIVGQEVAPGGQPGLEAAGVDGGVGDLQHVPGGPVHEDGAVVELHEPAEARHVALERGGGRVRGLLPQHLDQSVGRHHRVPVGEQDREESPRHPAPEREERGAIDDSDRPEDAKVHVSSLPDPLARCWCSGAHVVHEDPGARCSSSDPHTERGGTT